MNQTSDPSRPCHPSLARAVLLPGDRLGVMIFPFLIRPLEPMPWPAVAALLVAFALLRLALAQLPAREG